MLCYKDRTFCTYYASCEEGKKCSRALTPEVQAAAEKWWGSDEAPIAVWADYPSCYKPKSE